MSNRQTPEQLAAKYRTESTVFFLDALRYHGYVIVHADDVPASAVDAGTSSDGPIP